MNRIWKKLVLGGWSFALLTPSWVVLAESETIPTPVRLPRTAPELENANTSRPAAETGVTPTSQPDAVEADPEAEAGTAAKSEAASGSVEDLPPDPASAEESDPAEAERKEPEDRETVPEHPEALNEEPEPTAEEQERYQQLQEADQLYRQGQLAAAEQLYRQAKPPFSKELEPSEAERPDPILEASQLPPAGRVYWREAQMGLAKDLETRIFVPLQLLVEEYPEFIPGHLQLAQALQERDRPEEALQVLDRATQQYPEQAELVKAKIDALGAAEEWLEASITARQFALLYSDHPEAQAFSRLADEYLQKFRAQLRERLTGNVVANVLTGALGYTLTGGLFGPLSALESTVLLLRGESAIGRRYAAAVERQLDMVEDEAVLDYVDDLGQRLAQASGRDDFEFEFGVILDDRLNAFALPGGKIFINAGAIAKTQSEAELAGLLAHEISHAVLSHGFQLVTEGNLTANLTQFLPFGGTAASLLVLNYSRGMERQADLLGTNILAATGYAADGLRNLMVTLDEQQEGPEGLSWLSTHPDTDKRIRYLERHIVQNDHNRYAYEGVEQHRQIQKQVKQLLADWQKEQDEDESDRS